MVGLAMCSRPKPCTLHLRRSGPMSAVVRLKTSETSSTPNGALDHRDQRDRYPDQFMTVKEARNLHFGNEFVVHIECARKGKLTAMERLHYPNENKKYRAARN